MAEYKQIKFREVLMGKLGYGCDLLEELTRISVEHGITVGRVGAIGAVKKGCLGYYNQGTQAYQFRDFERPMEIAGLIGNVSLKDGNPFVHAHVTLADESGASYGGHLAPGNIVFACEFTMEIFDGPAFNRCFDKETGLQLWSI
ncbi:MAG: DNA-binding protein [Deltaproteobacteria bacterium]|nr:DNA-binding protein [Deltaproteobacteria bacterium]